MAKRRVKKRVRKIFLLLVIVLILVGGYFAYNKFFKGNNDSTPGIIKTIKQEPKETWPKVETVSLIAGGDTVIHNDVANYAKTNSGYNFKPFFTDIKDEIQKYDLAYYNQETVFVSKESGYTFYPTFGSPEDFGDAMIDTGFNMVSLANNHSNDRGETGINYSIKYWKSKDNVYYSGMAESEEDRTNYQIKEINGIKYAMLAYTYGTNGIPLAKDKNGKTKDYLVNVYSDELAKKDIEALRDKVDVLIVAMHWGVEYQLEPNATQKKQAQYLADLGVDIVIGNHPHCIQPVEWIDDTLIIYSLGNLISNQVIMINTYGQKVAVGALASMDIVKTTLEDGTSKVKVDNLELELIYTYKNTSQRYYKVVPFSKMTKSILSNYETVYNDFKKVLTKYDDTIKVKPSS